MPRDAFPLHAGMFGSTRLPVISPSSAARGQTQASLVEIGWLVGMGVFAGLATSLFDFGWKIPGHAILRSVPFLACGLAVVPRRNGGFLLGLGAILGVFFVRVTGGPLPGPGAGTSLVLVGPILEIALRSAKNGWRVYLSFVVAGIGSNFAAFLVRAAPKVLGWEVGRGKPLSAWLSSAVWSYAVCGLLAGLISAAICFRASPSRHANTRQTEDGGGTV